MGLYWRPLIQPEMPSSLTVTRTGSGARLVSSVLVQVQYSRSKDESATGLWLREQLHLLCLQRVETLSPQVQSLRLNLGP